MTKKSKKSKRKLTAKQLHRIRSNASKKGWETKRKKELGTQRQLESELKAFRAHRDAQAAEERAAQLRIDALLAKEKLTRADLDRINKEKEAAEQFLADGRKELRDVYVEIDFLYERRAIHFTEEQYKKLLIAEQMHEFDEMAWAIAEEMDEPVTEIYDLWLSP